MKKIRRRSRRISRSRSKLPAREILPVTFFLFGFIVVIDRFVYFI